jgi:hypothetical protein
VDTEPWEDLVGLLYRIDWEPPWPEERTPLFELDIYTEAPETILNMFENSADVAGAQHGLESMFNFGYSISLFISYQSILIGLYDLDGGLNTLCFVDNIADRLAALISKCSLQLKLSLTTRLADFSQLCEHHSSVCQCVHINST